MPDQSSASTEHAIMQEITAPLESLPDDPLAVVTADFATVLRGYDRDAVDAYVAQTRQLIAELQAVRSPDAAVRRALERVGDQISGILQRAHETAEQITAQSRSEAEDRLEQARREAGQIIAAAEQRVRDLDADTDRIWLERQRIVSDAEDLAGQLLAVAKEAAERFPSDEEEQDDDPGVTFGEDAQDDDHGVTFGGAEGDDPAASEEAALMEGTPVEAGAPEAEAADRGSGPLLDEDKDELEDEGFDPEKTMAFRPLREDDDETAVLPEEADDRREPPRGEQSGPTPSRGRSAEDEPTGVIRPASEAAHRRLGR